jgi:hypothetical protein
MGDMEEFKDRCLSFESEHIVSYYGNDDLLLDSPGSFLDPAVSNQQFIIITKPTSILRLRTFLNKSTPPLIRLSGDNSRVFSSVDMLDEIMVNNEAVRKLFYAKLEPIITSSPKSKKTLRIYTDMSASLWDIGDEGAALKLEKFWAELYEKYNFVLYCSYPIELVVKGETSLIDACHDLRFVFAA